MHTDVDKQLEAEKTSALAFLPQRSEKAEINNNGENGNGILIRKIRPLNGLREP